MNDVDSKRLSLLVPQELYDRFIEYSQKEYKNTTTQITDLMAGYVKAREADSEASKQEAMLAVLSKSGEMIYKAIQGPRTIVRKGPSAGPEPAAWRGAG